MLLNVVTSIMIKKKSAVPLFSVPCCFSGFFFFFVLRQRHFLKGRTKFQVNNIKAYISNLHTLLFFFFLLSNGSKMNGSLEHLDQPDPDAIKMFVGQIPRSWSETELKELFEPFGAVHQINILRDRTQNPPQSKGMTCMFSAMSYWLFVVSLLMPRWMLNVVL